MKTIKQIADELGVSKQRVYRYIKKNCISEAHQENGVMYYNETAEILIKQGLSENQPIHEAHQEAPNETLYEALKNELDQKNRQIDELNARLAEVTAALVAAQQTAQAAQALHAGTIQQQLDAGDQQQEVAEPEQPRRWWQFWRSK